MKLPRLYPIVDTAALARLNCPTEVAAQAMLAGGARILQFRHKGHYSRHTFDTAERIAELCRNEGVLFIIDDRADIALLLKAGLHVGQDDLPPEEARKLLGPQSILGFSTHNARQLEEAAGEPVDYLAIGPVFGTTTKENPDPPLGVEAVRKLRDAAAKPLVAIGGITRRNALSVLEAGADSVAVIGDLLPEVCSYESIRDRIRKWEQLVKE